MSDEIDFDAPVLQTSELRARLIELQERHENTTICKWCEDSLNENPIRAQRATRPFIHVADGSSFCTDDQPVYPREEEELEEWELEELGLLQQLDKVLDGGLAEERSLINDDHAAAQLRDEAEDFGVPEFIRSYVDWDTYVDERLAEHTMIEIDNGRHIYHYTG